MLILTSSEPFSKFGTKICKLKLFGEIHGTSLETAGAFTPYLVINQPALVCCSVYPCACRSWPLLLAQSAASP